ncbi:RDD family protein [Marinifilum sp.]|uniref:RDD family protein n=1 Tax=Marinifilum sp. TaxID=2033137 RepID=UPI003BA8D287
MNENLRIRRIVSMLLDHFIMCMIIVPPMIMLATTGEGKTEGLDNKYGVFIFYFFIFIYLNKDFFQGKSIAKRILGYQIVDRKRCVTANEFQCFIRNLTICIAWPLEVIISLFNPQRRIGDFLANTMVIKTEKQKIKLIITDIKTAKLKLNYIGIILIAIVYFYGLNLLFIE